MRYFVYLSYDGANYHGWQIQPNAKTVQETLMKGVSTLLRQETEVIGAGRTDTGVNASLMVAHFNHEAEIDCNELTHKLNRLLPPDIAIKTIVPVTADAHARFSATSRTYQYHVCDHKNPFARYYSYRCPFPLNYGLMNEAAQHLFDYIDFTSFSKLHTDTKTNNCKIMQAHWDVDSQGNAIFTIQADRFLRNMVRAIVGTLIEVGRGAMTIEGFCRVIEQKDRCAAGSSMPGNALFLTDITYPKDIFINK